MTAIELYHDWHDAVFDDAKAIAALMGMDIDSVYYSGFWSQGDGACFEGSLGYRKGCAAAVRAYAPLDTELHAIADAWTAAQRPLFYQGAGSVKQSGHYNHEYCTTFSLKGPDGRWLSSEEEEALIEVARDFMRWIYHTLEREYEYQYAWTAAQMWEDAQEDMREARSNAKALVSEMRAAIRNGQTAGAAICAALRSKARSFADDWERARERRDNLAGDFAYWQDGQRLGIAQFAEAHL